MKKTKQRQRQRWAAGSIHPFVAIPNVADHPSRKEWEDAAWRVLVEQLALVRRPEEFLSLFDILITSKERHILVQRATAIGRILSGRSYSEIGEELWLSSQTVSATKKALREYRYRSYRERGKIERKKRVSSRDHGSAERMRDPSKRRIRTKYGTLYV